MSRWTEAAIVTVLLVVAGALRALGLEELPRGLHGDEAIFGLEAIRILEQGWIGPYTPEAIGNPTGAMYLAAAAVWLLGEDVIAVRLPQALAGTAAVGALYLLARRHLDRPTAIAAALLLATLAWHLHLSRVGFALGLWSLFAVLGVLGVVEALRRGTAVAWWLAAGASVTAGIYVYSAHLLFAALVGAFALVALVRTGRSGRRLAVAAFAAGALVTAAPMAIYAADPANNYFGHHRASALFNQPEWQALDGIGERAGHLAAGYGRFWSRACCGRVADAVDGSGVTPLAPPPLLALAALGLLAGVRREDRRLVWLSAVVVLGMPAAAVLTLEEAPRRAFALAPFLVLLAAMGVVELARLAARTMRARAAPAAVAAVALAAPGIFGPVDYFSRFPGSEAERFVFSTEFIAAVRFMEDLPPGTQVVVFSGRWSAHYEPRRFLAPAVEARDGSREYRSTDQARTGGRAVFLLLDRYRARLPALEGRYPGGRTVRGPGGADPAFLAYFPPAPPDAAAR